MAYNKKEAGKGRGYEYLHTNMFSCLTCLSENMLIFITCVKGKEYS